VTGIINEGVQGGMENCILEFLERNTRIPEVKNAKGDSMAGIEEYFQLSHCINSYDIEPVIDWIDRTSASDQNAEKLRAYLIGCKVCTSVKDGDILEAIQLSRTLPMKRASDAYNGIAWCLF
jgi:hypothetical protein